MDFFTTSGWLETWCISKPRGNSLFIRVTMALRLLPNSILLPLSCMEMAIPIAGLPSTYILFSGGSGYSRLTSAISPKRKVLPLELNRMLRTLSVLLGKPVSLMYTVSPLISALPAGVTLVSPAIADSTAVKERPNLANLSLDM